MTSLERRITSPGERPDGDGWECIHSGCSYDRSQGANGRYWLWQRVVYHYATDEQIERSFDAHR